MQVAYLVLILGMGSANERRRYSVTSSLIGRTHNQNHPSYLGQAMKKPRTWYGHIHIRPFLLSNFDKDISIYFKFLTYGVGFRKMKHNVEYIWIR